MITQSAVFFLTLFQAKVIISALHGRINYLHNLIGGTTMIAHPQMILNYKKVQNAPE